MTTETPAAQSGPPLPTPDIVMAVGAHPDDVEFGCGATLAKWAAAGAKLHHVICTDGSKGTWDPDADMSALVARRADEQRAASIALGGTGEVTFLGAVDGELGNDTDTRRGLVAAIRAVKPDVVLGHDPWKRYRLHPDHHAAGRLTVDAIVAARDPHFFPDVGPGTHRPSALLLFEADVENHLEPVDDLDLARRVAGLEAHRSQYETTHYHRVGGTGSGLDEATLHAAFVERERDLLRHAAAPFGAELGEAFALMDDL